MMTPRPLVAGLVLLTTVAAGCRRPEDGSIGAAAQPLPTGVEWRVVELYGTPAGSGAGGRAATLSFDEAEARVTGFAGCNRFSGSYTTADTTVQFSPLISTRMACDAGMELERRFTAALESTREFRVDGSTLVLSANGRELARLVR